ncbi:MAG: response regulator [SAR202 cluster bacterium]|jgi:DNA-binding response OmpR family regulator|nr:response regulator [SAR202 cluster bacterium]MDP6512465.1 response regulator [SAR202 cluster bacterium]MDP6714125.1 response regulator [SAR202 cluster bacterium]
MTAESHPLVLLIDDDPDFLEIAELAISESGYGTATAQSGLAGLRLFQEHEPDLVVLDLVMPGMNGIETLRLIRESSDCPIIILTLSDAVEMFLQALELGVNDYLTKDAPLDTLLERINIAIGRPGSPVSDNQMGE